MFKEPFTALQLVQYRDSTDMLACRDKVSLTGLAPDAVWPGELPPVFSHNPTLGRRGNMGARCTAYCSVPRGDCLRPVGAP